jgi:Spy/CpxP family protein refolding chaperone
VKKTKMSLAVVLALAISLGLAASSWARPGGGMGCGMMGAMNLTPDQAGKFFDLKEKFHSDTAELRKKMMVGRAELAALWKAEKPDEKAIQAKQKELNDIRGQMQQKHVSFQMEARKIDPQLGQGMGKGMRGHGGGMGHGCCPMGGPGGGAGPGGCPMVGPGGPPPAPPAK